MKGGGESGFGKSGDGTRRLRTHVWHAKRFTMTKLWGFHLPLGLHGSGRGSRALLKWYRQGAVVHDASYHSALQLEGPEDSLLSILSMVLTPSPSDYEGDIYKHFIFGNTYRKAILHNADDDSQTVGPVTYMWRPFSPQDNNLGTFIENHGDNDNSGNVGIDARPNSGRRQLWLWMHPSAFSEAYATLKSASRKKRDETGILVDCVSLEGQLARIDVMGSNAFKLLRKVLNPVACSSKVLWQLKKCSLAKQNSNVVSPGVFEKEDSFAPGAVMHLVVTDPRTVWHKSSHSGSEPDLSCNLSNVPEKESKNYSDLNWDFNANKMMSDLPSVAETVDPISHMKELWDISKGIDPPVEENVLCMQRHHRRLEFFCVKSAKDEKLNTSLEETGSRLCPILLLRANNHEGSLQGWSIILPLAWTKAFWIPIISAGAHAVGLREKHWIACDIGLPCFPSDFPDCNAYSSFKDTEAAALIPRMGLCPPAVRPFKVPTKPPWNSLFMNNAYTLDSIEMEQSSQNSIGETGDAPIASRYASSPKIFVARTSKALGEYLWAISGDHLLLFPYGNDEKGVTKLIKDEERINQASNAVIPPTSNRGFCYLRVLLHAFREGIIEEGAVISAPHFPDIPLWTSSWDNDRARLQIPDFFASSYFKEEACGNWDFQILEDPVSRESYRWPIGFVTTGFVRGSKKPVAVGLCEAVKLAMLRHDQWSQIRANNRKKQIYVLVRNLRSTAQRLALATIVLECRREDVDFL